jgi:hypothetical protein
MEPKVLANDAPAPSGRSRKLSWLPALLLTVAVLAVLLALSSTLNAQSTTPASPLADPWATEFCRYYGMACATGDFNGDGYEDIIQFSRSSPTGGNAGDVYVRLSNGSSFGAPELWATNFAAATGQITKVGDFNGDHKDDIIYFVRGDVGAAYVALANESGDGFVWDPITPPGSWVSGFCKSSEICDVGDFNRDGKDDIARFTRNAYITDLGNSEWGKVYVAKSDGTKFTWQDKSWIKHFCMGPTLSGLTWPEACGTGDFNGDGLADIITFSKGTSTYLMAKVYVALNAGNDTFESATQWNPSDKSFCYGNEICGVGDFNDDGLDDIITYLQSLYSGKSGYVYVGLSNGSRFPKADINLWTEEFCTGTQQCGSGAKMDTVSTYNQVSRTGDFNKDGNDDVVSFDHNISSGGVYPGYAYVKLASGNSFVDYVEPTQTPTPMPPLIWVPLVFR